jgi:hypothetical protein
MLSPGYIGVPLSSGHYDVVFTYNPPKLRAPLLAMSALILILLVIYQSRKNVFDYFKPPGKR